MPVDRMRKPCSLYRSKSSLTKRRNRVTRTWKYCEPNDCKIVPKDVLDLADCSAAKYNVFCKRVGIDRNDGGTWLCAWSYGLSGERNVTYTGLKDMCKDQLEMVLSYLLRTHMKRLATAAAIQLCLNLW